ncbi:MAG: D-alanine--D-alanine ligase family protein [Patescibacteria group bacterium]|jgi:D-alanine--D-alanine ligase
MPPKIRVAIICGGISNEREVSLKSGQQVLLNLDREKYEPQMVEIAANGQWLLRSADPAKELPTQDEHQLVVRSPFEAATAQGKPFDVAFLALHGKFGEDGRIQALLELVNIPYTGSGVLASALCMDKAKTHNYLASFGIVSPNFLVIRETDRNLDEIQQKIDELVQYPCVVKPNESGSSVGITIVKTKDELSPALAKAFKEDKTVLIQQLIEGREITCGVLGNSDQNDLRALPPVEVIADGEFFDYNAKYSSAKTQEICPAPLDPAMTKQVQDLSLKIHALLDCDGLSRSDFILRDNDFYFLEINTLPGLTEQSLCPKEVAAAGMSYTEFLNQLIDLALQKTQDNSF